VHACPRFYITPNEHLSVCPYQVTYFITKFDALFRKKCMLLLNDVHLHAHSTVSSAYFNYLKLFINLHFFPIMQYLYMAMTNAVGVGALFQCSFLFNIDYVYQLTPTL